MLAFLNSATGRREDCAGDFLLKLDPAEFCEAYVGVGYVTDSAFQALLPFLGAMAAAGRRVEVALGANRNGNLPATTGATVAQVEELLGPGVNSRLAVVYFKDGREFHPKVYVFVRPDGTIVSLSGSSNWSMQAFDGSNVESNDVLDSRDVPQLAQMLTKKATAVPGWTRMVGAIVIRGPATTQRLVDEGILAAAPLPRQNPRAGTGSNAAPDGATRKPIIPASELRPKGKRRRKVTATSVPVKLPKKPKKVPPNMRVGKVLRDARDELNWSLEEAEERSRPHYAATLRFHERVSLKLIAKATEQLAHAWSEKRRIQLANRLQKLKTQLDKCRQDRATGAGLRKSVIWDAENGADSTLTTLDVLCRVYGTALNVRELEEAMTGELPIAT